MACLCGKNARHVASSGQFTVVRPDGSSITYTNEAAARRYARQIGGVVVDTES